jgi:hypothetical protein
VDSAERSSDSRDACDLQPVLVAGLQNRDRFRECRGLKFGEQDLDLNELVAAVGNGPELPGGDGLFDLANQLLLCGLVDADQSIRLSLVIES